MLMYTNFDNGPSSFPNGFDVFPEGPKWFNSLTKDLRRSLTDLLEFYDGRKVNFEDSKYDEGDEVELPDYFDSEENVGEVKGVYPDTGVLIVSIDNETFVFDVQEISKTKEEDSEEKEQNLFAVKIPSNQYFSNFLQQMAFEHGYNFAEIPNDDAYLEYETRPTDDATREWFIFNQEDHKISFARQLKNFHIDFKVEVITYERFKNALEGDFESDDEKPDGFLEESFAVTSKNEHQREAYIEVASENGFEKASSWNRNGNYIVFTKQGFIEYWNELQDDWVSEVYEDIGVGKLEELLNEKQV